MAEDPLVAFQIIDATAAGPVRAGECRWARQPAGTAVEQVCFEIGAAAAAFRHPRFARAVSCQAGHTPANAHLPAGTAVEVILLQVHAGRIAVGMTGKASGCRALVRDRQVAVLVGNVIAG